MPIININVPQGSVDPNKKNKIVKYLSQALLKAEGLPNTKEARSLVWCFLKEIQNGTWAVGGKANDELKFYIQVYLFKEALNEKRKKEIAETVNKTLKEIYKNKLKKINALVVINEIPDYNFCVGGNNIGINELAKFLNLNPESLKG